jgi:hypothetical protein
MLATVWHETAETCQPIHEYGSRNYFIRRYGSQTKVGRRLGNDTPEEGALYAGRGDTQLTGEDNYEKSEIAVRRQYPALVADFERRTGKRFDLTVGDQPNDKNDPDNAQDPVIAYAIMSYGMRTGLFTNRKLSDYFNSKTEDPLNARRIINGTDRAESIKNLYWRFKRILVNALAENDDKEDSDIDTPVFHAVDVPPEIERDTVSNRTAAGEALNNSGGNAAQANMPETSQPLPDANQNGGSSNPEAQTIEMDAPAKDGSTATIAKTTVLGIAVPACIATIVKAGSDAISQGFVSASQIGDFVMNLVRENQKYVIWAVIAFMAYLGIKKGFKQASFMLQMWINGRKDMNNIVVKPNE